MKISVDSIQDIKVVGFDVFYVDSNGNKQSYPDGLIDIAKGKLTIEAAGRTVDISKLVDAGEDVSNSINNAFLENSIFSSLGNADKEQTSEQEKLAEEIIEEQDNSEEQLKIAEKQLQERLEEIERIEQELEEQKEELEEQQEELQEQQEDLINLESLLESTSAGELVDDTEGEIEE